MPDSEVRSLYLFAGCLLPLSQVRSRVYVLTEASRYILVVFGILIISSVATGLWLVSVPSATGTVCIRCSLFSSNLSVQPCKCPRSLLTRSKRVSFLLLRSLSGPIGQKLHSLVSIVDRLALAQEPDGFTDLVTFVCIIIFTLKLKANHGQSRMSRLLRTILQDGVLYFFVMAGFHIAMALSVFFGRVSALLPSVEKRILIPQRPRSPYEVCHRL